MKWALIAKEDNLMINNAPTEYKRGDIINIIEYDGVSTYAVPKGTFLKQVDDCLKIGDQYI
jgi:hypothetical protein